jgi:sugar phosphate isomerase/epimerase
MKSPASSGVEGDGGDVAGRPFAQVQVHVPLLHLKRKLSLFLDNSLNPEIYFNHSALESIPVQELTELADTFNENERSVTIHGPFYDLSPGAVDPAFRALTSERMRLALKRAALFSPHSVIFHPGYDPLRFAAHRRAWLKNSIGTWRGILPQAAEIPGAWILIENIFERDPYTLAELLGALPSPPFGFCLDTGHFQVFSDVSLDEWMAALGPYLREVHLHDPVIGTVEAHSENDLWEGLAYLERHGIFR